LEDLGLDERIILRWILKKWDVNWIHLAQDRFQLWALMTAVMNLWVLTVEELLSLCLMETE
jgi:hypothetical protein